jgi:hypothetical protein
MAPPYRGCTADARARGRQGLQALALEVAAQLARTLAIGAEGVSEKLNRKAASARIEKLVNVVENASAIRRGISGARRGLDAAEDAYEAMAEEAMAVVLELADRL